MDDPTRGVRGRIREEDVIGRCRGALLGLACGDALGTTLEFAPPGSFAPIADMVGGGPFGLRAGEWTDDTSMALCLAESLLECRGFDPVDQLERYLRWWREGHPEIEEVARGSFERREPPEIAGTGYVVRSLEAALWALHRTDTFRAGALLAVNLGDDADTTGAVYGQLAGAIYGEHGIPEEWRARLAHHDLIRDFADRLCELSP
jgi:ADP-ribosylglycohydrolase